MCLRNCNALSLFLELFTLATGIRYCTHTEESQIIQRHRIISCLTDTAEQESKEEVHLLPGGSEEVKSVPDNEHYERNLFQKCRKVWEFIFYLNINVKSGGRHAETANKYKHEGPKFLIQIILKMDLQSFWSNYKQHYVWSGVKLKAFKESVRGYNVSNLRSAGHIWPTGQRTPHPHLLFLFFLLISCKNRFQINFKLYIYIKCNKLNQFKRWKIIFVRPLGNSIK